MTRLIKIGNSQGIRIPKALIQKAHLQDNRIDLEIVENGLLLKPIGKREKWRDDILSKDIESDEALLEDFLDDSDLEDYEW